MLSHKNCDLILLVITRNYTFLFIMFFHSKHICVPRMPYFDRWMRVRMEHPRGVTLLAEDKSTGQHMGALVGFIYQR